MTDPVLIPKLLILIMIIAFVQAVILIHILIFLRENLRK